MKWILALLVCILIGCQEIANPASQYCVDQGGKLDTVADDDGSQRGVCTLQDGTVCDEWAFFNGECPCGECPQFMPPGPNFCPDGIIVQGDVDDCGCQGPPQCVTE